MKIKTLFFKLLLVLLVVSCEKKEDEVPPVIKSFELNSDTVGEKGSLRFTGEVSDDQKIESVYVTLSSVVAGESTPHITTRIDVTSKFFSFQKSMYVDFDGITSGRYDVKLDVYDGNSHTTTIRTVYVKAIPKEMLGWYVLEEDNTVSYFNTYGSKVPFNYGGAKAVNGAFNHAKQQLVLFENDGKQLSAYSGWDGVKAWSNATVTDPHEVTTSLYYAPEKLFFLGNTDSRVKAFNQDGSTKLTSAQMKNLYTPEQIGVTDKYILAYTKLLNQSDIALDVLNRGDGSYFYSIPFVDEMLSLYGVPGDKIYGITKQDAQVDIKLYDLERSTTKTLKTDAQLNNAVIFFADGSKVLIKSDEGISLFQISNQQLTAVVSNSGVTSAAWDDFEQTIIYAADGKLSRTALNGTPANVANTGFDAKAIWIRYNK